MASQILASVEGMSACTTPKRGERVHDRGFFRGVKAAPDIAAKIAELVRRLRAR
jgi:hypothetical protein